MLERKVNAIYDALDAGDYKRALKNCNKHLASSSELIFFALKAMALSRLKKNKEALDILEYIRAQENLEQ